MSDSTRIIRFYENGGPLLLETVAVEQPASNEVRLRIHALGLNRVEEVFHSGSYFIKPVLPSKLGVEAAGVVEAVGSDVDPNWVGKRVAIIPSIEMTHYGVAGETAIVPADVVVELPDNVPFDRGAATWMAYLTAYGALPPQDIGSGDFVLINAASSSVGLAMIQTAHVLGAKTIAVTRSAAKKETLLARGADYAIASEGENFVAEVKAITGGNGARIVLDPVAGNGLWKLAEVTATAGSLIVYGYLGTDMFGFKDGQPTPFPFLEAVARNLNIRGYNARFLMADHAEMARGKDFITGHLASGDFQPNIDQAFPLEKIEEAYDHLRQGRQVGKIIVTV